MVPIRRIRQSRRMIIRQAIETSEVDIIIARDSAGGQPTDFHLIMQGEPLALHPPRINRNSWIWYDPLRYTKDLLKDRIVRELQAIEETTIIFPGMVRLSASVNFIISTDKDIDNMLKPLLDVLEGIVYENDSYITEIHAKKDILTHQAAEAPDGTAETNITISIRMVNTL